MKEKLLEITNKNMNLVKNYIETFFSNNTLKKLFLRKKLVVNDRHSNFR